MIGVGDLVVCVDASPCKCGCRGSHLVRLELRGIYHVAEVYYHEESEKWGLQLTETGEDGWLIDRFRKVSPKSASKHIEDLKKLPALKEELA